MKAATRFSRFEAFRLRRQGIRRTVFVCFAVLCWASWGSRAAQAQSYLSASGAPPFAAPEPIELGFTDTANGSFHGEIPIASIPQRATKQPLQIKFVYNSSGIWSISCLNTCNCA